MINTLKRDDFYQHLENGKIEKVIESITKQSNELIDLVEVLGFEPLNIHVRIGVSAVLETFVGHPSMSEIISPLNQLTHHKEAYLRSDACYFLSLTKHVEAKNIIEFMLYDPYEQVRVAAQDALDDLSEF